MALIKCENGHYYDDRKYSVCPQCGLLNVQKKRQADDEDDQKTVRMEENTENHRNVRDEDPMTVHYTDTGQGERTAGMGFVTGWMICTKGSVRGRDYRLFDGKNFVGRSAGMDVCIAEDPHISREKHCVVVYERKKHCFYLVPGKELTYLNGNMLDEAKILTENDVITIGETELVFIPFCKEGRAWI